MYDLVHSDDALAGESAVEHERLLEMRADAIRASVEQKSAISNALLVGQFNFAVPQFAKLHLHVFEERVYLCGAAVERG